MRKDTIKSLIALKQHEMPFDIIHRDNELPVNRKKIITIPGVRRCGKSTLMMIAINELLKTGVPVQNILWIGFDDERLKNMTSDDLDEVIASYMEMYPDIPIKEVHMFLDEIQIIGGWEYFVLRVYKSYCKNIYISGSNATMLSTELNTALRGYPLEYKTYPLSFNEFCRFKGINANGYLEQEKARVRNTFMEFNRESSFPEVVLTESATEKLQLLNGYFDTMLLKDVAEHYGIANLPVLRYFVKRIMANLTKPTSILSIYNDIKSQGLKINKDELYKWAGYVCDVFMFIRIPKYERSLAKEQRSQKKYYCIDNGLRSAVLLPQSDDNGKLLENTVFLHLNRNLNPADRIFYFQESAECDFVVQRNEHIDELIQVTWDMSDDNTREREINGILEASKATECDKLTIITIDEERSFERNGKTIHVVPAWKWLLGKY
ncbi:ATP-binding protein [uncultured Rikenella sp.]|uniref:ATP-binding protein n=1 Tax=uncultured Rikenella sp. TaxID=368003 RepID=UPI0026124273|nr:ATP-binding protein [uncultured Rikenella sp.]